MPGREWPEPIAAARVRVDLGVAPSARADRGATRGGRGRAFRGLLLVFFLSFLNLTGLIITLTALGGTAPWTRWQFIGIFGLIEAASGLANVLTPNIWRLPIAELQTSERVPVRLAASAMLLPHFGGLARCAAGVVCLAGAAWHEGVSAATLALLPLVLALAWCVVALSALVARAGVARPDVDVVQFVIRWGGRERETAPLSIGASVLQFLLSIATIPAAKLLEPSVLFRPELAPSPVALAVTLALAVLLVPAVYGAWAGRIGTEAPPEQQREAERLA
jgi:hypothetical protein